MEKAINFPAQVKTAAASYLVTLLDYTAIDMPSPPNAVKVDNAKAVIQRYYKLISEILQMLNHIEHIKTNPDQFVNPEAMDFDGAENKLTDALNAIKASASQCADNVNTCTFTPISLPDIKLPKRIGIKEMSEAYANKGDVIAKDDPLALSLLEKQPDGPNRQGFLVGLGIADGHTLPGPGKDKFGSQLPPEELAGFQLGVTFSVHRNRNLDTYSKGAAVIKADPAQQPRHVPHSR